MNYTEEQKKKRQPMSQSQKSKLREIAIKKGYKPPNQKGLKRVSVWNKGKICPQLQGEKQGQWRGEDASYSSIHRWVRKWKGIPIVCEKCGELKTNDYSIQWANIDHQYRRVLDDYIALCIKCHRKYDRINN